jgi:4'-phosphopantetheinyl transferase
MPMVITKTTDLGGGCGFRVVRRGEAGLAQAEALLTRAERDYFARDQIGPRRKLRLMARAALREWLGEILNLRAESVPLTTLPSGRLELMPPASGWSFSVSTRGDVGFIAVGRADAGSLGVDVEKNDSAEMAASLAAPAITEREHRQLDALPPSERTVAALRWWVRKEAVAKALGLGVGAFDAGLDLSALSLTENPDWQNVVALRHDGQVRDLAAPEGYVAAMAIVRQQKAAVKIF